VVGSDALSKGSDLKSKSLSDEYIIESSTEGGRVKSGTSTERFMFYI
jgi:hypothetical protein